MFCAARAGLSARGLTNAIGQLAPDFRFLVGDRIFFCPTFLADFPSPTISRAHIVDPTVDSFVVATAIGDSDFKRLLSLGYGDEIELTHESKPILSFWRPTCPQFSPSTDPSTSHDFR
jgi:hypothetical protein